MLIYVVWEDPLHLELNHAASGLEDWPLRIRSVVRLEPIDSSRFD